MVKNSNNDLTPIQIKVLIEIWNIKMYLDHKFSTDVPLENMLTLYNSLTGESIWLNTFIDRLGYIKQKGYI